MDPISAISTQHSRQRAAAEGFEGPEKRLEIDLRRDAAKPKGMRAASLDFWTAVMDALHAKILDTVSTQSMDAYILTESSLFVLPHRIVLITCGTTKLLDSLPLLLEGIGQQGLEMEWVQYSRKNFTYPWSQPTSHSSFGNEYELLHRHFPSGHPYVLGPLDGDHYIVYIMDKIVRPVSHEVDQHVNLIMYDMQGDFAQCFYSSEFSTNSEATSKLRAKSGIEALFQSCEVIQDTVFEPCGYSANALKGEAYHTTHITPEEHCSYASYETNEAMSDYTALIRQVVSIFKPQRFTAIVFLDELSPLGKTRQQGQPIGAENEYAGYTMTNRSLNEFEPGYHTIKCNYSFVKGIT